jgi:hypothetical protein
MDMTYNLAFFLGPGLPLTLGGASGPRATAEVLLTPFFFTPSDGGSIDEAGVPVAAGVLAAESDGRSPCDEPAATGPALLEAAGDEASFTGDSSFFTSRSEGKRARILGGSLRVTSNGLLEDFRRMDEDEAADTVTVVAGDLAEAVMAMVVMVVMRSRGAFQPTMLAGRRMAGRERVAEPTTRRLDTYSAAAVP